MIKKTLFITLFISLVSCGYFTKETPPDTVVTLGAHYLDKDDIARLLPQGYTLQDSTQIVDAYINKWATDHLLMDNAIDNISQDRQVQLDQLIENYQIELYAQEYLGELTKQNLDTLISEKAILAFYEKRKEDFKLNEDLVQFRFVQLDPLNTDLQKITKWFNKGDVNSLKKVDSLRLSYRNYFLNDSIWIKKSALFDAMDVINVANEKLYIKENKTWKLEDSLGVYLVRFNKVLKRGDRAPLSYVKPTVKQVLLNRSKLAYIKKLEKDLLNDAINSDKLQINN
ncbi:peptidyl-prolyl cis-trans isomerase [Nonlabens sp. MB-3u-79]|uniref:peptidyl-prolyl cis-trans isomerase n=1 Tax=Nonlabens sp. MB-3u-79 TaxID=2058134 RepID=UPI001E3229CB|nr:peptidyl-prolyl cis-trans isomerase [Nonlabens sp. MB-3u-79]